MDSKIGTIEHRLKHEIQPFGSISVTIVDTNGNILLNTRKYGKAVMKHGCMVTSFKGKPQGGSKMQEKILPPKVERGVAENDQVVSKKLNTEKDDLCNKHVVTKEDTETISTLLGGKRGQIFTAKLNRSNYICFIDSQGLLVCRGCFNVSDPNDKLSRIRETKEEVFRCRRFRSRYNTPETACILVACKVSGILSVVIGDSNSEHSMVDIVKDISEELKGLTV